MIIVKVKQRYNENVYEFERYNDAELLISVVLGSADKRTTIEIMNTDETEASRLQDEVTDLETSLNEKVAQLFAQQGELDKLRGALACTLE